MIVPIVLYNGGSKWTVPLNFKEILDSYQLFQEHALDFRYHLIDVSAYGEDELLKLSNIFGAVFYLDQATNFEEIIERLKKLIETIRKMNEEEFRLFVNWAKNILARDIPDRDKEEINEILDKTRLEEVDLMVTNVERVLKKSYEEAEKQGIEKVARQMLADGENIEKIARYTGLSKEQIIELK